MKKIATLSLVLAASLALAACSSGSETGAAATPPPTAVSYEEMASTCRMAGSQEAVDVEKCVARRQRRQVCISENGGDSAPIAAIDACMKKGVEEVASAAPSEGTPAK